MSTSPDRNGGTRFTTGRGTTLNKAFRSNRRKTFTRHKPRGHSHNVSTRDTSAQSRLATNSSGAALGENQHRPDTGESTTLTTGLVQRERQD